MGMHATEFVRTDDTRQVPAVVALVGNQGLLVQQSMRTITRAVFGEESDEEISRCDGGQAEWRDVHDLLATISMFASHRVVLVDRADDFIKQNRSALEGYVKRPVASSVLVLQPKSFPGNTKLAKAVAAKGLIVECTELKSAALVQWLEVTARERHGVELARDAAGLLVELVGSNLTQLESEVAKLGSCVPDSRIDVEAVRTLVGGWQVQSTFDMLAALRRGQTDLAIGEFRRLSESGEAMPRLMGGVAYVYRRLARATELARQGCRLNDALKKAGVYYKEIDESNRYLRRIGRCEAERILERLLAVDDGAGRLPDQLLVERLLVELAGAS